MSYQFIKEKLEKNSVIILDGGNGGELEQIGAKMDKDLWVGKSAIGLTVSKYMHAHYHGCGDFGNGTWYLTTQKILQDQYIKDFGQSEKMRSVKSAKNHSCKSSGANCKEGQMMLRNSDKKSKHWRQCVFECPYKKEKSEFLESWDAVANFAYFLTETNKENLSFIFEISKKLNLKKRLLIKTIQKFNGLKYRQQTLLKRKNLVIINDSKSTSFSSSIGLLKSNKNIYWLLGGIPKKGDKFNLSKKYFINIKAFIYGKNKKFFNKKLKGKIVFKNFRSLKDALIKILAIIKKEKLKKKTIIFSPSAASFDSFKNFEDRGLYFNKLIKRHLNGI